MATISSRIAIVDSSVWIELLRNQRFREELSALPFLIRNSAVVLAELRRGASTRREQGFIDELEQNHRVFFPGAWEWRRSGEVLAALRKAKGYDARKLRDLHFDALTALTARAIGATVITCDGGDFSEIRRYERFELVVWVTSGAAAPVTAPCRRARPPRVLRGRS